MSSFSVRLESQGSSCAAPLPGRGGRGEMVGCAFLRVRFEVMRISACLPNMCFHCAAGARWVGGGEGVLCLHWEARLTFSLGRRKENSPLARPRIEGARGMQWLQREACLAF